MVPRNSICPLVMVRFGGTFWRHIRQPRHARHTGHTTSTWKYRVGQLLQQPQGYNAVVLIVVIKSNELYHSDRKHKADLVVIKTRVRAGIILPFQRSIPCIIRRSPRFEPLTGRPHTKTSILMPTEALRRPKKTGLFSTLKLVYQG